MPTIFAEHPTAEELALARNEWQDDDLRIDDDARASHTNDGVWVEAWVFVEKEEDNAQS